MTAITMNMAAKKMTAPAYDEPALRNWLTTRLRTTLRNASTAATSKVFKGSMSNSGNFRTDMNENYSDNKTD